MDCLRNNFTPGVLLDGRFRTVSPLNHGSFGMVFKARDQLTNEFVAIKCTTKSSASTSPATVDDKSEELAIHERIRLHPNIVGLVHSFESAHHVYLVLEFCANGDLYEAIRLGRGPLQTEHVRDFMFQLISAVEHMHSKGVFHRDIKPENIFLDARGVMKLGDFGLATTDKWSYEAAVGSDRYMAPEQFDHGDSGYSPALADLWSIGICLLNVLFSRNPFATPTTSDPLYRDFVADRQSLFDVFPNMSQDTFEALMHCLAIDPEHRSFSAVKEALRRVVSFTTDDESLDDFCADDLVTPIATANRQPLRTPSITTPHVDQGSAFPWAKALAMSPQQQIRQLSAVMDEFSDPLFANSDDESKDWMDSGKPDSVSLASFVDSGLGVSVKTTGTIPQEVQRGITFQSRPPAHGFAGSLPISAARPIPSMAQAFGGKRDFQSKSWSDMLDEEEEAATSDTENAFPFGQGFGARMKTVKSKEWGYESSDGRSTPRNRVGLTELSNPSGMHNSRNRSPHAICEPEHSIDEHISEHTGFVFEEHANHAPTTNFSRITTPRKSSFVDKWAKLGARRRNEPLPRSGTTSGSATPKPAKAEPVPIVAKREAEGKSFTPTPRKRSQTRVGSWKGRKHDNLTQHGNKSETWTDKKDSTRAKSTGGNSGREMWLRSNDWRQHSPTLPRDKHFLLKGGETAPVAASDIERVWRHELHL